MASEVSEILVVASFPPCSQLKKRGPDVRNLSSLVNADDEASPRRKQARRYGKSLTPEELRAWVDSRARSVFLHSCLLH